MSVLSILYTSVMSIIASAAEHSPGHLVFNKDFAVEEMSARKMDLVNRTIGVLPKTQITIAVASTITSCGNKAAFSEGAAVLQYSIKLASYLGPKGGKYAFDMYIFYHPGAKECALPLQQLGFRTQETPTPISAKNIRGRILRERIASNGCCGEKELIKLEAFRLTQYPVVVHLDLDVLVLQPLDPVIDFMMDPPVHPPKNVPLMWPEKKIPRDITIIFTKDYNTVAPRRPDKPFQGGFFIIKPSLVLYQELIDIVIDGDYRDGPNGTGWGGEVGPFYGGMTIQGLLPWYFEYLHPGRAVELNRCVYNSIADNPTNERSAGDTARGRCRTNEETCEDCRKKDLSDIVIFHYTACFKPWTCAPQKQDRVEMRLCHKAHHEWFLYRKGLEESWGRHGGGPHNFMLDHFLGYCKEPGFKGYEPINFPYRNMSIT